MRLLSALTVLTAARLRYTVSGRLVGALLMAVLRNGCNIAGIPNYLQNIVVGAIIIAAMGLDRLGARK